jgi:hypothetical protein
VKEENEMKRSSLIVGSLVAAACVAALVVASASATKPATPRVTRTTAALAPRLAAARLATAKYATNLAQAKEDGYGIITRMIPNMGYHFMNGKISGFNITKPQILVYQHRGRAWQLGALEWVFPSKPAKAPLPGATYGAFPAACHYVDGTFYPENDQSKCATKSPQTGAKFNFWHPGLWTLHVWLWYPNPAGLYSGINPLVAPFNNG